MERARIGIVVLVAGLVAAGAFVFFAIGGGAGPGRPDAPEDPLVDPSPKEAVGTVPDAVRGRRAVEGTEPVAPATVAAVSAARLIVRVVIDPGSEPLGDVEVFASRSAFGGWPLRQVAVTDEQGMASFDRLADGEWLVDTVFGMTPLRVALLRDRPTEVTLRVARGAIADGVVVDPDGRGIAAASIWLSESWGDARGGVVARTDAAGRFAIAGIGRGRSIAAWADGFAASAVYPVRAGDGERTSLQIVLTRAAGTVVGRVTDHRGQPIADATVLVGAEERARDRRAADGTRIPGPPPREVSTDAGGRFEAGHVEPGEVIVQAGGPGYAPWRGAAQVAVGQTVELDVVLDPGAVVEGRASDRSAAPVARVTVETVGQSRFASRSVDVAADGTFRLADLSVGAVRLRASAIGGAGEPAETELALTAGTTTRWDPVLDTAEDASKIVAGRVVGADGRGVDAYRVVAEPDPPARVRLVSRITSRGGLFRIPIDWPRARLLVFPNLGAQGFPVAYVDGVAAGTDGVEIRIDPLTLSGLRAQIVDTAGRPVEASLQVWHNDARIWRELPTQSATGRIELAPMLAGRYTLELRSNDHPWLRLGDRDLPAGSVLDLGQIELEPGGTVEGSATFVDGGVPTQITLRFVDEAAGREVGVAELRDGRYRSNPLPLRPLTMVVEGEGIAAARLPLTLEARSPVRVVDLSIQRGIQVTLRIALKPGTARPQWLNVGIFREQEPVWTRGVGQAAALEIDIGLAPGTYRVLVQSTELLADVPLEVRGQPVVLDIPIGR